jgi:hypothetical protein
MIGCAWLPAFVLLLFWAIHICLRECTGQSRRRALPPGFHRDHLVELHEEAS